MQILVRVYKCEGTHNKYQIGYINVALIYHIQMGWQSDSTRLCQNASPKSSMTTKLTGTKSWILSWWVTEPTGWHQQNILHTTCFSSRKCGSQLILRSCNHAIFHYYHSNPEKMHFQRQRKILTRHRSPRKRLMTGSTFRESYQLAQESGLKILPKSKGRVVKWIQYGLDHTQSTGVLGRRIWAEEWCWRDYQEKTNINCLKLYTPQPLLITTSLQKNGCYLITIYYKF